LLTLPKLKRAKKFICEKIKRTTTAPRYLRVQERIIGSTI